jgi:hypothetical protein
MGQRLSEIDVSVAHASRMYDYLLGGTNNFAVDREAAEAANAGLPGGIDGARATMRANRAFLGRVVRQLAEAGIRQFLDIGSGIPHAPNVHEIAQKVAPDARVVYVDNDPIVLAHSHSLLQSSPAGASDFVQGDLRDPTTILRDAAHTLDLTRPVAVLLVAVLHFVGDEDRPHRIVRHLMDAVPRGSYLALSHGWEGTDPEVRATLAERLNQRSRERFVWRSEADIAAFFAGLELLEPGVVPVDCWRPDGSEPARPNGRDIPIRAGLARVP